MTGFFIKKAFFDGWDNLISIVLQNFIYILILGGFLGATMLLEVSIVLSLAIMVLLYFACSVLLGGTAATVLEYSNYKRETWGPFAKGIKRNFMHSLLFFFISIILIAIVTYVIPFYLALNNIAGFLIGLILVWLTIIVGMALPYYYPLMNLLPGDRPFKTFKKCFIILSDNIGFSFFFLIYNAIVIALSVFTLGIIPGVTGYMLAGEDAVKLLMFKYDWLEKEPVRDAKEKRRVPWDELLYDEREKVGPRSLKSMLFPWKF